MKTVKQVAKELGVSKSRVRFLCLNERIIKAEKLGRDWMISDSYEIIKGKKENNGK